MEKEQNIIDKVKGSIKNAHNTFNVGEKSDFPSITIEGIQKYSNLSRQNILKTVLTMQENGEVEFDGNEKVLLKPKFYK
jgi:hypothetical protein